MDATEHDLPSNRADFSDCETLDEKLEKHEQNVEATLDRARQGETVNLSDLMADAEQLHREAANTVHEDDVADAEEEIAEAVEDDVETETLLAPVVVTDQSDPEGGQ